MDSFISSKLVISHMAANNLILIVALLVLSALFLRRAERGDPLGPEQTTEVRGLIMLLIVLGHLWTHVSSSQLWPNFAGSCLASFLFLSGFGITLSYCGKRPSSAAFIKHRIHRVMVPYWLTTLLFLGLDIIFLGRTLDYADIVMTFAGINQNDATRLFDYVRWYITFQLVWYAIFLFAFKRFTEKTAAWLLVAAAGGLLIVNYYVYPLGWNKFFAFPSGCVVALYRDGIVAFLKTHVQILWACLAMLALYLMVSHALFVKAIPLPSLGLLMISEANSMLWTAMLLLAAALLGRWDLSSRFLDFAGRHSYEIFLLHGPFLIKYNPVFTLTTRYGLPAAVSFSVLMVFIVLLAMMLRRVERIVAF